MVRFTKLDEPTKDSCNETKDFDAWLKNSDRPPNILDGIFEVYTRGKSKKLLASATRTKLSGFLPKI